MERMFNGTQTISINARLTWRIENISKKIEDAQSGETPALYSPPFFSDDAGNYTYFSLDAVLNTSHKICTRLVSLWQQSCQIALDISGRPIDFQWGSRKYTGNLTDVWLHTPTVSHGLVTALLSISRRMWLITHILWVIFEYIMMTSSNGNIFFATGPLSGEFSSQRSVTRNFDVLFDLGLNKRLSLTIETLVIWDAIGLTVLVKVQILRPFIRWCRQIQRWK